MDIDPRPRGYECWTNNSDGLYTCKGEKISDAKPRSCNMGVWWDADLLCELLDGTTISKWDYANGATERLLKANGCSRNNGSKSNPCLCADILGDWREEVIWRTSDNKELRVYTTTIPAERRLPTLMHDPVYRLGSPGRTWPTTSRRTRVSILTRAWRNHHGLHDDRGGAAAAAGAQHLTAFRSADSPLSA
jgi:rhamnogalacturonan endolyase